ncbi:hypothetical protein [Streptomyces sp. NBC_01304]|uniref:hypothetical protein n=1 Tax=Streptomyces sp. NBC_01304 TaxID=2903818 RepID=UPI002E13688B|nr:hypothetical protein OG430_48220 [Streptomyces sp. NBC_01304]
MTPTPMPDRDTTERDDLPALTKEPEAQEQAALTPSAPRKALTSLSAMLWDKEIAQAVEPKETLSASAKNQPSQRSWRQILKERPWARGALRLERGAYLTVGEFLKLLFNVVKTPFTTGDSIKDKAEALILTVIGVAAAVSAIPTAPREAMGVLTALFLWRSWTLGNPQHGKPGPDQPDSQPDAVQPEDPASLQEALAGTGSEPFEQDQKMLGEKPEVDLDTWIPLYVEHAVALSDRQGKKGMHLVDLLEGAKQQDARVAGWDVARLRKEIERLNIPVSAGINMNGRNTIGVRYDALEQALKRRPRVPPSEVPDLTPPAHRNGSPSQAI